VDQVIELTVVVDHEDGSHRELVRFIRR